MAMVVGSGALLGVWSVAPSAIGNGRGHIANQPDPAGGTLNLREAFEWYSRAKGPGASTPLRVIDTPETTDSDAFLRSHTSAVTPRASFFEIISDIASIIGADTSQRQR